MPTVDDREPSFVFHRSLHREVPTIDRGQGALLWDRSGKRYLDGSGGAVVVNVLRSLALVADGSHPGSGPRLARLLRHRDPYVRVTAATALADSFAWVGSGADSAAIQDALRQGMQDSDEAVRIVAAASLLQVLTRSTPSQRGR